MSSSNFYKGPFIKDVRSHGGRGLSSADILRTRGEGKFFKCGRLHFLVQKFRIFQFFEMCKHRKGGREVEPVRNILRTRGRGQFFAILFGHLLWTTPNIINLSSLFFRFKLNFFFNLQISPSSASYSR